MLNVVEVEASLQVEASELCEGWEDCKVLLLDGPGLEEGNSKAL